MTLSEWMGQNGYSEYNSASGRRKLQLQYGITGDSYSANMALWKKLREEKSKGNGTEQPATAKKEPDAPVKRQPIAPLLGKVATLQTTPIPSAPIVRQQAPMQYDGTPIKGTEVYFTPAGQAQEPYELGEYQVFKQGGKVNYLSYTH